MKEIVKPVKYNKRKSNKPKSSYSLRELVGEIAGVVPEDINFDAEYTAIRRVVRAMQKAIGYEGRIQRIAAAEKEGFVIITKRLYEMLKNDQTRKAQKLIAQIRDQEQLKEEDLNNLIEIFQEGLKANPELEEHRRSLALVEKEEQFFQMKADLEELIKNDIGLIAESYDNVLRETRMKEYIGIIKESKQLREWRDKATEDYKQELFKRKIIVVAEEKGFDTHEILEGKNYEHVKEVFGEIIRKDVEYFLKQQSNEQPNEETDSN